MTATSSGADRRRRTSGRSNGSGPKLAVEAAQRAKGAAFAGGLAAAGLAVGTVIGSKRRARRRRRILGLPMPRASELKSGAERAIRSGRWVTDMQRDVRAVREQAEQSRRQSPVEVLLTGLTSRRLPRHGSAAD
jgi:hypothetical protein